MSADGLQIAAEPADSDTARSCLASYYEELQHRFVEGFDPALSLAPDTGEFAPPRGTFLIVRLDGEAVACGGLKQLSADTAYLKRMWVAREARGRGIGRLLLGALEQRARELGYSTAALETHKSLAEAQLLYLSSGYREVEPFNDELYAHHWFEKPLR
ncbi:GNAT superfamily N-acetyltransferase [Sphingomonas sp. F9_3S_D5_B_2]